MIETDETQVNGKAKPGAKRKPNAKVPVCFKVAPSMRQFLYDLNSRGIVQAAVVDLGLELAKLMVEHGMGIIPRKEYDERVALIERTLLAEGEKADIATA